MEIIVTGLDRLLGLPKHDLLRRLQTPETVLDLDENMPPLVGSGNIGEALDYVTVSLPANLRDLLRDDVLDYARQVLSRQEGLDARWKAGRGADKTRQLSFLNPGERDKESDQFSPTTYDSGRERGFTPHIPGYNATDSLKAPYSVATCAQSPSIPPPSPVFQPPPS
ncbi:hypothetical protein C0992_002243 [Termitomyces sp. T32_za158]|nr:hypothetical protein C0992_002243 [Termitomyces sp. T32_za158]